MYRSLDPARIVETCRDTRRRIGERFPGSGLGNLSAELLSVSERAAALSEWLARPHLPLRVLGGLGALTVFILVLEVFLRLRFQFTFSNMSEFLQGSEAAINEAVLLGVAVFFLLSLENRLKRRRALKAIHVLRSMAHIIDMHQLTKDPERINERRQTDPAGAKRPLAPAELIYYLDFSSDLLALISKIGALYVQKFNDPVTLAAVTEVENLTTGLSRKMWQKIMILDRIVAPGPEACTSAGLS